MNATACCANQQSSTPCTPYGTSSSCRVSASPTSVAPSPAPSALPAYFCDGCGGGSFGPCRDDRLPILCVPYTSGTSTCPAQTTACRRTDLCSSIPEYTCASGDGPCLYPLVNSTFGFCSGFETGTTCCAAGAVRCGINLVGGSTNCSITPGSVSPSPAPTISPTQSQSVIDFLYASPNHVIFAGLVQATPSLGALLGNPLIVSTVFAPQDSGFSHISASTLHSLVTDTTALTSFVLTHFVSGVQPLSPVAINLTSTNNVILVQNSSAGAYWLFVPALNVTSNLVPPLGRLASNGMFYSVSMPLTLQNSIVNVTSGPTSIPMTGSPAVALPTATPSVPPSVVTSAFPTSEVLTSVPSSAPSQSVLSCPPCLPNTSGLCMHTAVSGLCVPFEPGTTTCRAGYRDCRTMTGSSSSPTPHPSSHPTTLAPIVPQQSPTTTPTSTRNGSGTESAGNTSEGILASGFIVITIVLVVIGLLLVVAVLVVRRRRNPVRRASTELPGTTVVNLKYSSSSDFSSTSKNLYDTELASISTRVTPSRTQVLPETQETVL